MASVNLLGSNGKAVKRGDTIVQFAVDDDSQILYYIDRATKNVIGIDLNNVSHTFVVLLSSGELGASTQDLAVDTEKKYV